MNDKIPGTIKKNLPKIEFVLVAIIAVILLLNRLDSPGPIVIIAISTLAILYFLSAYIPTKDPVPHFLAIISYKVLGIGWSVCTLGILFHLMGFPGAPSMLGIGATSVAAALLIRIFIQIKFDTFKPDQSLLRSIILIAIAGFLLSQGNPAM